MLKSPEHLGSLELCSFLQWPPWFFTCCLSPGSAWNPSHNPAAPSALLWWAFSAHTSNQATFCGPAATLNQTADMNPNCPAQPEGLPVGQINCYRLLIVSNLPPRLHHPACSFPKGEKRIIKNSLSRYWSLKIAQYHYFYPFWLPVVTFFSLQGVWPMVISGTTYCKAQALFFLLHPVQFLSC